MKSPKLQRIVMVLLFIGVICGLLYVMKSDVEGFKVSDWIGGSWLTNGCTKVNGVNQHQKKITGKCGDVTTKLGKEEIKACPHYDEKWKAVEDKNAKYKYINLIRGAGDKLTCN